MGSLYNPKNLVSIISAALMATSCYNTHAGTQVLPIADGPLTVGTNSTVPPNVMLLMDDSGSMDNIVWSIGYINAITKPASADATWQRPTYNDWGQDWNTSGNSNLTINMPNVQNGSDSVAIDGSFLSADVQTALDNAKTDLNTNPTVTQLATYVPGGNATAEATGVKVATNGKDYTFPTYKNSGCSTPTTAASDQVACVGAVTKTLTVPMPAGNATKYYRDYLNYLFDNYDDGDDLTAIIPNETRMQQAKAAAITIVSDEMNSDNRFGLFSFQGNKLRVQCNSGSSHISTLETSINNLSPNSSTPLAETYYDITRYFKGNFSNNASPIQYRCQQNFVVVITDGYPNGDNTFPNSVSEKILEKDPTTGEFQLKSVSGALLPDWDGEHPATTYQQFVDNTLDPKSDGHGDGGEGSTLYLDDLAKYGYDIDLKSDSSEKDVNGISFNDPNFLLQNLNTYTIGFTTDNKMLKQAADYGHGKYYTAQNGAQLTQVLQNALDEFSSTAPLRTTSPVTLSSGYLDSGTKIFYSEYLSEVWSGTISGYNLNTDGTIDASSKFTLSIPVPASRDIYSINGTTGKTLEWTNLSTAQQDNLCGNDCTANDTSAGQNRLAYIKGDQTKEESRGGSFRDRISLLGDIMNSAMVYVKESRFRYTENHYLDYKTNKQSRKPMLYAGANDGMLHAFELDTNTELFAYVPNAVFPGLKDFTNPNYSHRFFVDGTPTVGDAYFGTAWHTVLVGGLNKGGQGIYALDVSSPATFGATNVLWEFSDSNDPDLGYTYSRPAIVKMADEKWYAVFGNGYNNTETDDSVSSTGDAALYIVNLGDASDYVKIPVPLPSGETSDFANGLATVAPIDINGDFIVDRIYAGDLVGNLWRFDVGSSDSADWTDTTNIKRLFSACQTVNNSTCTATSRQAITTRPEVGRGPTSNSVLVYFGTGKYLTNSDPMDKSLQTFYAIQDDGTINLTRASLQAQTIDHEFDTSTTTRSGDNLSYKVRTTSANAVDYATKSGWYMDLSYNNVETGERVIYDPILRNGRIVFVTNYYTATTTNLQTNLTGTSQTQDVCAPTGMTASGKGWLMELDALMGRRLRYTPFDVNADNTLDGGDYVQIDNDEWVPVSGRQFDENIAAPGIASQDDVEFKYTTSPSSVTGIEVTRENKIGAFGRQSWQQLK